MEINVKKENLAQCDYIISITDCIINTGDG
jgi:hypothetical protein